MKKVTILLVIILAFVVYLRIISSKKSGLVKTEEQKFEQKDFFSMETKQFGPVEVILEPKELVVGKELIFAMSVNTHSGDLEYDWTKKTVINDNLGNEYKALEWTGETGGHHLNGDLIFEPLKPKASTIILTIMNVGGVTEKFEWEI
jgi:hypothetical protein